MKLIDSILNKVTMYRLVVYELCFLLAAAFGLSLFGAIAVQPLLLLYSAALFFFGSVLFNWIFAWGFDAPFNPESTWITSLILALAIAPPSSSLDASYLPTALSAIALAVASKYIFSIGHKHLFNPAALALAGITLVLGFPAPWWVGTPSIVPFVFLAGLLVVRKIHRFDLWWSFILTYGIGIIITAPAGGPSLATLLEQSFLYAPVFFFSTVMLTEPLTMPHTRMLRVVYGVLIAILTLPQTHLGSFYFTPELALLAGNLFAYIVSPKHKLVLTLKEKIRLSPDVYEFVFESPQHLQFRAGQYLEWTLAHESPDSRSVRRYFTIVSAPEDPAIRLGVKFYAQPSTFKRSLSSLKPGETIIASQLAGDFTLPRRAETKLAFVAGGIGITPFRSQIEHMLEKGERRDLAVFYANKTPDDAVYRETLERARRELGSQVVYAFTEPGVVLPPGSVRAIDAALIAHALPDYRERTFYISGPQGMVNAFMDMLRGMGVPRWHIKTDYFPGFA